jgi:hypothetical protein
LLRLLFLCTLEEDVQVLDQPTVDALLALDKLLEQGGPITFPTAGAAEVLEVKSTDGREAFLIDINRRGRIKISKCMYQERYNVVEILLRLDIDGPLHENPDGTEAPCPHLHIYKEGFGNKWAQPIPADFTNPTDLIVTLREFLRYCRVQNIPNVNRPLL